MQTFLPFPDFAASATALDDKRLGKQRVETMQIMRALLTGTGWIYHPATKQWAGYEMALLDYQLAVCDEWAVVREHDDSCADKTLALVLEHRQLETVDFLAGYAPELPPWLGRADYHRSHQSNLIRKDETHYAPLFPGVPADLEYVWPSKELA